VHQHHQQETPLRLHVQPRHRHRQRGDLQRVNGDRLARLVGARQEEERQVPERPDHAEQQAGARHAEARRQPRQRVAAPAKLFPRLHRRGDDDGAGDEVPRLVAEARPRAEGDAVDDGDRQLDGGDVADGEEVPARADVRPEDPL